MTLRIDPEQNEVRAIEAVTEWRHTRVLEIGCGEGRLTQRLARLGAVIHAIDPDAQLIRKARKALPQRWKKSVSFKAGQAERLGHKDESFDVVVFAWSL